MVGEEDKRGLTPVAEFIPDPPPVQYEHPSQSRARSFPDDVQLRRAGFKIYARPKTGEAIWECDGELYTHSQAMELIS